MSNFILKDLIIQDMKEREFLYNNYEQISA